jgi:rhodanese-related sulfurtransferase
MLEIAAVTLRHLFKLGSTFALLDVREHGEYNAAHIPGASSLPRRLLEHRIRQLVPGRQTQLIVCDDDGRRARLAARTLERLGYTRVAVLDDGVNGWASDGFPTEWGMNVPSKAFGERVEVRDHVPSIEARELAAWIARGDDLVILDTRTPEEFGRFCIPGGRSVPNGELPYRIGEIVRERPDARIVVNCAGRTRSIIGTRALQRMGFQNVVGLKNGTSGWVLAGLKLEAGAGEVADRVTLPEPSDATRAEAEAYARRVMAADGVLTITPDGVARLLAADDGASTYLIDVRTRAEFEAGHIPGFWWFPGGQVVQRSDDVVAVRNGTVVLACDGIARAGATASWLRQLGFPHVYVLDGGTAAWADSGRESEAATAGDAPAGLSEAQARVRTLDASELAALLATSGPPLTLHVGTSREFAAGHVPGSQWVSRGWLEVRIEVLAPDWTEPIVVTDPDGADSLLAAATLLDLGYHDVTALVGGTRAWAAAGRPLERGLTGVMEPPVDVVPAGPERSYADMIQYLRWEEALAHNPAH